METILNCELCGASIAAGNRMSGLGLCDPCFHGEFGERLAHRRWRFSVERTTTIIDGATFYWLSASIVLPNSLNVSAEFHRKRFWSGLSGLFRKRLSVGDPLFDQTVQIVTRNQKATLQLLSDEGVQSAVLDLVGDDATVNLASGRISIGVTAPEEPSGQLLAELAVLAAHVERVGS